MLCFAAAEMDNLTFTTQGVNASRFVNSYFGDCSKEPVLTNTVIK